MLKNKVKELLKNKKVLSVCAFVVVAGGLTGVTLALSSSATSVNEVSKAESVKSNEESNKQDNSKDNKANSNKDTKKEETSNSLSEDKEVDTHEHDEDGNHVHEEGGVDTLVAANTGSAEETNVNSGTSSNTANTNSNSSVSSSSTNTGSSSTSNTNTGSSSSTVAPSEPSHDHTHDHVHKWVPITQQITHPEEGYWADELVSGAWTEEIPVYEERARDICNGCGLDITEDPRTHAEEQLLAGNYACGGYHTEYKQVQVGTNTVYHDAIYSKKWIVSSPAWVETVTTGYKCSDCGATK